MIKILNFESSTDENISHAVINHSTPLPQSFTMCASFKEKIIADNSFFTIYGETHEPWFTLSNWAMGERIMMWVRFNTVWIKVRALQAYETNFWINFCFHANILTGELTLSLNGESPIKLSNKELTVSAPKNLQGKLYLGFGEVDNKKTQFSGQIANINIFKMKDSFNIVTMSANVCGMVGDVVNVETEWENVGNVTETEDDSWKICNNNKTYRVAIPTEMNWEDTEKVCKKLGKGNITEVRSDSDLQHTLTLFKNLSTNCGEVWTPISDEDVEGVFKSSITGKVARYMPWTQGGANGGEEQNHVVFHSESGAYNDVNKNELHCGVCDLHKTTEFTLIGVCKDSYFGKSKLFLLNCL